MRGAVARVQRPRFVGWRCPARRTRGKGEPSEWKGRQKCQLHLPQGVTRDSRGSGMESEDETWGAGRCERGAARGRRALATRASGSSGPFSRAEQGRRSHVARVFEERSAREMGGRAVGSRETRSPVREVRED